MVTFVPCVFACIVYVVRGVPTYVSYQRVDLALGNFMGWFVPANYLLWRE